MDLTREQILEMSEIIAKACGMDARVVRDSAYGYKYVETDTGRFNPFGSWDDAMAAADALGIYDIEMRQVIGRNQNEVWCVGLIYQVSWDIRDSFENPDRLTAFCLALHEAAKAKLEGYQNEEGN